MPAPVPRETMMDPSPIVTVIIATYNKSSTLRYAINSVLWQTFTNFECWIIGDACTDDSEAVVSSFNDRRLHWYNLPVNSGYQSTPTNEALHRAKGKYVAYLNHDDIWLPNHLELLVGSLEKSKAEFSYTIMEWIRDGANQADIPYYPDAPRPPEVPALMHRLDVLDEIDCWKDPSELKADPRVDFLRRAQFAGKRFEFVPRLTVLKFDTRVGDYSEAGQQEAYTHNILQDPLFAERHLASLLAEAYWQLEGPFSISRARFQLMQRIRSMLVRRGIEPSALMPWLRSGQRISNWRRRHRLDNDE
ncbi:MAG: glycosyltransferase family 2 protein [Candidatus Promineifilaceae bacterium]